MAANVNICEGPPVSVGTHCSKSETITDQRRLQRLAGCEWVAIYALASGATMTWQLGGVYSEQTNAFAIAPESIAIDD